MNQDQTQEGAAVEEGKDLHLTNFVKRDDGAIKFPVGVVNYGLFHSIWEDFDDLLKRIQFLYDSATDEEASMMAFEFVSDLIKKTSPRLDAYWEQAGKDKNIAGGNNVIINPAA